MPAQAATLSILPEYDRNPAAIVALGALNRCSGRSALPLEQYFEILEGELQQLASIGGVAKPATTTTRFKLNRPGLFRTGRRVVSSYRRPRYC